MDVEQSQTTSELSRAINNFTALKIRLDTEPLLDKIELFLRGSKVVIQQNEKTGKIEPVKIPLGKKKANELGVQGILNFVSSIINAQAVQGNFKFETYENFIEELQIELTVLLVNNCYNWDIDDDDIDLVINFIMYLSIPFMSRTVDNKERESYGETIKTIESNLLRAGKGANLFNNAG